MRKLILLVNMIQIFICYQWIETLTCYLHFEEFEIELKSVVPSRPKVRDDH